LNDDDTDQAGVPDRIVVVVEVVDPEDPPAAPVPFGSAWAWVRRL